MTIFDYIVLVIIGLSVLISTMRGAAREVLSILGWVAAFYVARTYALQVVPLLPEAIPTESLKIMSAFLILFLGVLLVSNLLSIALTGLLKKIGAGWLNSSLGAILGFAKGLLVVCVLVFLAGLTNIPKDARWANAMFSPPLEALVQAAFPLLPPSIVKYVNYGSKSKD